MLEEWSCFFIFSKLFSVPSSFKITRERKTQSFQLNFNQILSQEGLAQERHLPKELRLKSWRERLEQLQQYRKIWGFDYAETWGDTERNQERRLLGCFHDWSVSIGGFLFFGVNSKRKFIFDILWDGFVNWSVFCRFVLIFGVFVVVVFAYNM